MKNKALALAVLAILPVVSFAQSIVIGTASGPAGGNASTGIPIAVTFAQNATPNATNTVRDIDSRMTYVAANITPVFGPGTIAGGSCTITSPGNVTVAVPDNGNAIMGGTICSITSVAIAAAAPAANPIVIANGVGSGCGNAALGDANCAYTNGSVNVVIANTPPVVTLGPTPAANVTLTGGAGTVPVNVTSAGLATASNALNCTIAAGTANFAVTAGATRTITAPATLGLNAPAVGVSCTPQNSGTVNGTLSCAQTILPTPSPAPAALTQTVVCPQAGASSVAQTPATATFSAVVANNSATQNIVLTAPAGNSQSVAVTCAIGGANAAAFNFSPAATFPVAVAAGATVNVPVRFSPTAATPAAQTATVICSTATANASVTTPLSTLTGNIATVSVAAGTAPGALALGTANVGPVAVSQNLSFTSTGGASSVACVVSGATGPGTFAAAPNPLNLAAGVAGNVAVSFTASGAGAAAATLTCTVTGASGGPFVYNLTANGAAALVSTIPTLGTYGLLLLVAGFLGMGVILSRRQA